MTDLVLAIAAIDFFDARAADAWIDLVRISHGFFLHHCQPGFALNLAAALQAPQSGDRRFRGGCAWPAR
jgi:hypothetical protein